MLLRSGTFKLPTSLPAPSDGIPTVEQQLPSPLLELSDSDSSPSMQSASGHSVEPPQPETLAIMAEASKNTVTPSKFYGDGREDVDKTNGFVLLNELLKPINGRRREWQKFYQPYCEIVQLISGKI